MMGTQRLSFPNHYVYLCICVINVEAGERCTDALDLTPPPDLRPDPPLWILDLSLPPEPWSLCPRPWTGLPLPHRTLLLTHLVDKQTNMSENITFPRTTYVVGNKCIASICDTFRRKQKVVVKNISDRAASVYLDQ